MIEKILNDRYHLESELGQGGMGTVYRAHDSVLDRDVALKLMSSPRLGTEGLSRLLVEAQTIAKLKHPNIVTVYDAGEVENQPYVVMEYIQGDTLNEHELDGFVEIVQVARQICAALLYAHEQNIIHRDLKPENVIIEPDGTVRLMDFGLAISTASRMTEKGLIMGTVYYMSPEQAFGREITPQSDLYSLGVILYELTTKRLPFEAEDALAVITQHIHAPVVPPRAKNEHIPVLLNDLILALLSKEPGDRPKSAKDVLAVLEDTQILAGDDSSVRELAVLDRIVRGRIVGRETEFQEARSLWQKTTTGQGQVLLISGEPGIGKTRLMREIVTHAEVSGGTALLGECYAESNAPYSAFSQIVRRGLSSRAANEIAFPDAVLADLLKLTPDLRLQYSNLESNPQLDPESEQQRLFEHMVAFCKTLAEKSPLLLVVDDVHWADSGTLAMLHHLIRRIGKQYVMILVTYREVELRESRPFNDMLLELNRQRQGTRLKLDRLDREANHEMLQSIFAMEVSSEFSDSIYRETDGNPFFIEEVCRALVESGALYYEDGEWHRPSMEELEIPQGIQIAVESRLSKLPKEHLEALRMAAILGREFEFDVLLEALDMDEDALIEALEAAEEAQMIQEADGTGDVAFVFVHALVPNAIVESVRTLRRRRLHKQAAKAIEELTPQNYEALAYHYGEAGDEGKTIKFHIMAGDRAAAAYANQDAEEHFLAALDLVVGKQEEADLLTKTGISQDNQGKFNSAIETWGQAIRLYQVLGDIDKAAELYARSGRALLSNGDTKAGLKNCHQGLSFTEGAPDGPGLARLLAETGRACHFNGLPEESRRYSQEALLMSERLDLTSVQIESLISLGLLMNQTIDQSVKLFKKAIDLAETNNLPRQSMRAHVSLASTFMFSLADYPNAALHLKRAIEIADQISYSRSALAIRITLAFNWLWQGNLKSVAEMLPSLQDLMETLPDPDPSEEDLIWLKSVLLTFQGNLNQALEILRKIKTQARQVGALAYLLEINRYIVWISLITKDFESGKIAAKEMIELSRVGMRSKSVPHSSLSQIYSRGGEIQKAILLLEQAHKEAEVTQSEYWDQLWLLWAQVDLLVAQKNWEEALQTFPDIIELTTEKGLRWHRSQTLVVWADAYLTRNQPGDVGKAREILEEAQSEFQDMGADGFVQMVEELLANLS